MKLSDNIPDNKMLQHIKQVTGSDSLCLAKWYNATVWLGSGMTTSCHHPPAHKIDVQAVTANPKALHNTPEKKQQRKQMQTGERPAGCEYCWRLEDMGRDHISDRVYKSKIYSAEDLDFAQKTNSQTDVNLRTLEIAFDRTCNFACSYCNPAFSTTWVKDIKQAGAYQNLISDGRNHFTHAHNSSQLYKRGQSNPYVEAFFSWWESDLHRSLEELRITGGEPTMSQDFWRLLDWFEHNNANPNMRFAVNSNLGAKPELIQQLINATHRVPHFHLYTSCEAVGSQAEYIRDGLVWDQYLQNLDRILDQAQLDGFHMMCTINALCLQSLPQFLDLMLEYKNQRGADFPTLSFNILRFPSFQSALVLPEALRNQHSKVLQHWLDQNQHNPLLHNMEKDQLQRLIDYLMVVNKPHGESFELPKLTHDFKHFYQQYDQRRGKDFCATFPALANWYNSL